MFRKSEREGYVMIDHRESPGLSAADDPSAYRAGIPVGPGAFFEASTSKCSHCECQVIHRPDRLRQRGYCYNCDHFICDNCAVTMKLTGVCYSFDRQIEDEIKRQKQARLII